MSMQRALTCVLLSAAVLMVQAQFGMKESRVEYTDFPFPEYAQPWSIGQNVCAFLKTASGSRLYTTCFPFKQKMCGQDTQFEYDCCPGYGHDIEYEGYKNVNWKYDTQNCMKLLTASIATVNSKPFLQRIGADDTIARKLQSDLPRTSGKVTVFAPYMNSYSGGKFSSSSSDTTYITVGSHRAVHLRDTESIPSTNAGNSLKVTSYSSGLLCVECKRVVSVDHVLDDRAVVHFVDGFITNNEKTVGEILSSQYSYFWSDVPSDLQASLNNRGCQRHYTVFVPSSSSWSSAKSQAGSGALTALVKEHILPQLVCAAAVCDTSENNMNLNNENMRLNCENEGRIYVQSVHEFQEGTKAYFVKKNGEFDQMGRNGVVYEVTEALRHSSTLSINDINWPADVGSSCINLDPAKKYIFLIPRDEAWKKFLEQDAPINPEEKMSKFGGLHKSNVKYRCLVRQYHVLEVGPNVDDTKTENFWSQFHSTQRGAYPTLAKWYDEKEKYGILKNHLYFQKTDTEPRIHFQFSPVRGIGGFDLKEGRGFMVDWVNIPPEEDSYTFLNRRPDLKFHNEFVKTEVNYSRDAGKESCYKSRQTVQLIIVANNAYYEADVPRGHTTLKQVKTRFDKTRNDFLAEDYILLNTGNLYFWIGDLGYMGYGELIRMGNALPNVTIAVYRNRDGRFYLWHEVNGNRETPKQAQRRWLEIVEYSYFKTDAMIWVVSKPIECNAKFCRPNEYNGKVFLPWTFATACGDYVSLENDRRPPLSTMLGLSGNNLGKLMSANITAMLESGPNAGKEATVICYSAGMVATKTFIFNDPEAAGN